MSGRLLGMSITKMRRNEGGGRREERGRNERKGREKEKERNTCVELRQYKQLQNTPI